MAVVELFDELVMRFDIEIVSARLKEGLVRTGPLANRLRPEPILRGELF
jgi:hypothetical protein